MAQAEADTEPGRRITSMRVSSLLLSRGLLAMTFGSIALFLPLLRTDLDLTFSEAGALSAGSTFVYALMQIPAGYLSDRFGPRRVLVAGFGGTSVLMLALAGAQTFEQALAMQAVFGFFRALAFAPGLVLIAAWLPPNRRSTALGMTVASNFGFQMVLNLTAPTIEQWIGWRAIFIAVAASGLIATVLFASIADDSRATRSKAAISEGLGELVRIPTMWLIAGVQFARLAISMSITFWMPTFLVEEHGLSLPAAGAIVALGAGMTALSNFGGGYLSDRIGRPLVIIGGSLAVLTVTSTLLVVVQSTALVIVVFAVHASFVQVYFGPIFALPIQLLHVKAEGLATGFGNFFANVGAFTFAFMLGAVKDGTGSFTAGFVALSVTAFLGLLLTIAIARTAPHTGPPAGPRAGARVEGPGAVSSASERA